MATDGFITDLKRKFQQGDIAVRLVYVNVAVFLVVTVVQIFLTLFNVPSSPWMHFWNYRLGWKRLSVSLGR